MNEQWQLARDYINARNQRERIIILLVAIAVVFFLIDLFWLGSALDKRQQLQDKLSRVEQSNTQAELQLSSLNEAIIQSASINQAEETALKQRVANLDKRLTAMAMGFVPAQLMPEVLETVLKHQSGVKLISLENIAPELIIDSQSVDGSTQSVTAEDTQLYRHGVKLELAGGYLETLKYLQELEALPWYFDWQSMHYQIEQYPAGKLELTVYTYSTDREWIGV